jgi:hypothetical protein
LPLLFCPTKSESRERGMVDWLLDTVRPPIRRRAPWYPDRKHTSVRPSFSTVWSWGWSVTSRTPGHITLRKVSSSLPLRLTHFRWGFSRLLKSKVMDLFNLCEYSPSFNSKWEETISKRGIRENPMPTPVPGTSIVSILPLPKFSRMLNCQHGLLILPSRLEQAWSSVCWHEGWDIKRRVQGHYRFHDYGRQVLTQESTILVAEEGPAKGKEVRQRNS